MPRTPSLRSLFLAWVCFSLAFSTVFQAFLTKFLIHSRYKTPIQNVDELFDSGITLAYQPEHDFILEGGDETELSKVKQKLFFIVRGFGFVKIGQYIRKMCQFCCLISLLKIDKPEVFILGRTLNPCCAN
jgi:hypothetical protein